MIGQFPRFKDYFRPKDRLGVTCEGVQFEILLWCSSTSMCFGRCMEERSDLWNSSRIDWTVTHPSLSSSNKGPPRSAVEMVEIRRRSYFQVVASGDVKIIERHPWAENDLNLVMQDWAHPYTRIAILLSQVRSPTAVMHMAPTLPLLRNVGSFMGVLHTPYRVAFTCGVLNCPCHSQLAPMGSQPGRLKWTWMYGLYSELCRPIRKRHDDSVGSVHKSGQLFVTIQHS